MFGLLRRPAPTAGAGATRQKVAAIGAAASTFLLVGCGNEDAEAETASSATATVTATTTVTTTAEPSKPAKPTALSKRAAGQLYLQTFRPWNAAAGDLDAEVESANPSLEELVGHAEKLAEHNLAAMKTIQDTVWPKAVRSDIDELYRELSTAQGLFESMAKRAETVNEFHNIYMIVVDKSHTGTSQRIRLALGLESS